MKRQAVCTGNVSKWRFVSVQRINLLPLKAWKRSFLTEKHCSWMAIAAGRLRRAGIRQHTRVGFTDGVIRLYHDQVRVTEQAVAAAAETPGFQYLSELAEKSVWL